MKTIFKIDDVEYIRKDEYDKVKNDLDKIKSVIRTSFDELKILMDAGLIDTKTKVIETQPAIENTTIETKKSSIIHRKSNDPYQTPEYGKNIWDINIMDDNGNFFTDKRKLKIHIKHVLKAQRYIRKNMTFDDFAELRNMLGLDYYLTHRLIYNIQEGVFKPYIQQWNKQTQPKIGNKDVPLQNNPEKRKEMGYC